MFHWTEVVDATSDLDPLLNGPILTEDEIDELVEEDRRNFADRLTEGFELLAMAGD